MNNTTTNNPIHDIRHSHSHSYSRHNTTETQPFIPSVVFIVPYRGRPQHKHFFANYLKTIVESETSNIRDSYELYFAHQCDARAFNRGATKNIGFHAVKQKYPNDYQNMTFVFNDIDTIPFAPIFNYATRPGVVKHFYGFNYALGGIVAINGGDFERINGFPNFWGWGMEDNVLQTRCNTHQLEIDRSHFFPIGNPNILHLFDGVQRIINKKDPWRATHDNGIDGLKTIHKLRFSIDCDSANPADNEFHIENKRMFVVNIFTFLTTTSFESEQYHRYDLREPPRKIIHPNKLRTTTTTNPRIEDWSHIPFYPNAKQRHEMEKRLGVAETEEMIERELVRAANVADELVQEEKKEEKHGHAEQTQMQSQAHRNSHLQQNRDMKEKQSHSKHVNHQISATALYSALYAQYIGNKARATPSANIKLGGVVNPPPVFYKLYKQQHKRK